MTDKQALKVLESWLRLAYHNADGTDEDSAELYEALMKTFDIINRQRAENERLRKAKYIFANVDYCADDLEKALKENEQLRAEIERLRENNNLLLVAGQKWQKCYDNAKAEAYKECIEKVKSELKNIAKIDWQDNYYYLVGTAFFDNLAKEMGAL